MDRTIDGQNSYLEKLLRLIPAEIVAAHLAIQGIVMQDITRRDIAILVSAGFLLVLLPVWLRRVMNIRSWTQIALTMGSFVVWVLAVSSPVYQGPFSIEPLWTSVLLILWTTAIPALAQPQPQVVADAQQPLTPQP